MDSILLHDMRNMGLRLNLLLSNLEEHYGDPDFKRSVTDLLESTVQRLDAVVERWSAHRNLVLIKVALDLNDLLREVLRSARPRRRPGAEGGPPRVEEAFGELPGVWGDPYLLKDAFQSVIQNALEAARGVVEVRTLTAARGRRRFALVEVGDDGPGMPVDFGGARLFRPFQTTKPDGVGLGLYTAHRIVRHHRGDIEVVSRAEKGTVVRILLPLPAPPRKETG